MQPCPYVEKIEKAHQASIEYKVEIQNIKGDITEIKGDIKEIKNMLRNGFIDKKVERSLQGYIGKVVIASLTSGAGAAGLVGWLMKVFGGG